jgi:hypothetical protein
LQYSAEITRYLIENILKWSENDIPDKLSEMLFRRYKLSGMLEYVFDRSPYKAINNAYPDKYRPWQFNRTPENYWNDATAIEAICWLMHHLKVTDITKLKQKCFRENKLNGLVTWISDNKKDLCYYAEYITPNTYKKWHFSQVGNDYWNDKGNAIQAVKWLVEEIIKDNKIGIEDFYNNHLSGLITERYNGSVYLALKEAYPNRTDWDIRKSKFEPKK